MNNYTQTDRKIHYLSQVLAKAGRTFVEKKEDDSHTNLGFVPEKNWLETHRIQSPKGKIRLVLRITDFCMLWIDEQEEPLQVVSTAKKYQEEVEQQLIRGIEQAGLDPAGFTGPLHFEIPEYSFTGKPYEMINRHNLDEWMKWRTIGNEACSKVLQILDKDGDIRIWPHHFDTGIYVQARKELGIGFGLAMKDEITGAPYFYMSGYPEEGKLSLEDSPALYKGEWKTGSFNGAILRLDHIMDAAKDTDQFIRESLDWFLDQ